MKIHPLIKEVQLRANKLSILYDIEDCVMSKFNANVGTTNYQLFNSNFGLTITKLKDILNNGDDPFVDIIYENYNRKIKQNASLSNTSV